MDKITAMSNLSSTGEDKFSQRQFNTKSSINDESEFQKCLSSECMKYTDDKDTIEKIVKGDKR